MRWLWLLLAVGCGKPGHAPPVVEPTAGSAAVTPQATTAPMAQPSEAATEDAPPAKDDENEDPIAALGVGLRDMRLTRAYPRVRKLVMAELSNVERLYQATPKRDPDRPILLRRLAETYMQLELRAEGDRLTAELGAQQWAKKDPVKAAEYRREENAAKQVAQRARKKSIERYEQLAREYPKWCQYASKPGRDRRCVDEIIYYLGLSYENVGEVAKARQAFTDLTETWNKSRFVPYAYLGLAELMHAEARASGDGWPAAEKLYLEVLKYPAPANRTWGYAALRLTQVLIIVGRRDEARQRALDVVKFAEQHKTLPGSKPIRKKAEELLDTLARPAR